jgi:hypothetical protein
VLKYKTQIRFVVGSTEGDVDGSTVGDVEGSTEGEVEGLVLAQSQRSISSMPHISKID